MAVYLVAFNVHPADGSPEEARRAELRADGFRSIIERRFAPERRRELSATCFFVETLESLATLTAFTESPDEVYIVPLAGPVQARSPTGIDIPEWLAARLPSSREPRSDFA
jgi:hypothetical protein